MGWEEDTTTRGHSPPDGTEKYVERIIRSLKPGPFGKKQVMKIAYNPKVFRFPKFFGRTEERLIGEMYYIIPIAFFKSKQYRNKKGKITKKAKYFLKAFKLLNGWDIVVGEMKGELWFDADFKIRFLQENNIYMGFRNLEIEKIGNVDRLGTEEDDENFYHDLWLTLGREIAGGVGGYLNNILEVIYSIGYESPLTDTQNHLAFDAWDYDVRVDEYNLKNYFT